MTKLVSPYHYQNGFIFQDIAPVSHLPEQITIGSDALYRYDDLHLSLVPVLFLAKHLSSEHKIEIREAEKLVEAAATKAVEKFSPKFAAFRNEFRICRHPQENRMSLVCMAHVDRLHDTYELMSQELRLPLPTPPAHVTLYTRPHSAEPVALRSDKELEVRSRPLSRDEALALKHQIDPYKSFRWSMFMTPGLVRNNLIIELHVPGFRLAKAFYTKFGFTEVAYDPISGGGDSDLGYVELKREDSLGRAQLNFYGDKQHVAKHAHFNQFPTSTPRGYGVEITIPVDDVEGLWHSVGSQLAPNVISQPLEVKRWGKLDFRVVDPYGFYVRFTEPVDWWQDV